MSWSTVTVDVNDGVWSAYTRYAYLGMRPTYAELRARLEELGITSHVATPDAFDALEELGASSS